MGWPKGKPFTEEHKNKISKKQSLKNNPNWNGGIRINRGYRYIKSPDHPDRDSGGYVFEHRLVVEKCEIEGCDEFFGVNEKMYCVSGTHYCSKHIGELLTQVKP